MMQDEGDDPSVVEMIDESPSPPVATMRAAVVTRSKCSSSDGTMTHDAVRMTYGEVPRPALSRPPPLGHLLGGPPRLILRVLACSLSPRDAAAMRGDLPPGSRLPPSHVPGSDVCGVVVESDDRCSDAFKVGDEVVAVTGRIPTGGLAEYASVDARRATPKPDGIDAAIAAACPSAGAAAVYAMDHVSGGDRVLVLGGSGGVGSCCVQLCRIRGASYVAATSRQRTLVRRLGADLVVNYFREDWWEREDFASEPFDVVIDCVGDPGSYERSANVLRAGGGGRASGCFVAIAGDGRPPPPDLSGWWRDLTSRSNKVPTSLACGAHHLPRYRRVRTDRTAEEIAMVLRLVRDEKLSVVLHNADSFPFTERGVRDAVRVQCSGHAHGKVVVAISKDDHDSGMQPVESDGDETALWR